MSGHKRGFTLIEVLISGLILFSVLSVGIIIYRTSIVLMDKISITAHISRVLPSIMEMVKAEIQKNQIQGMGEYSKKISFKWSSSVAKSSQNILSERDPNTGDIQYGNYRVKLNDVILVIKYNGDISKKEAKYAYKELFWSR